MQKLFSLSNKLIFWGVLVILIFVPLFFKFPLLGVDGTFVSIRLEDILVGVVLIIWFLNVLFSGQLFSILKDRLIQAIILFFFVGFVSLLSGAFLTQTVSFQLGFLHLLRRVETIMLLPVLLFSLKSKRQAKVLLFISFFVLVIVNVYALGQKYLKFPIVSTTTSTLSKGQVYFLGEADRISSTFSGHYDLAVYLLMATILLGSIFMYLIKDRSLKNLLNSQKIIAIVSSITVTGVSLLVLVMTATRLSFVATILGLGFLLMTLKKWKFILALFVLTTIGLSYPSQLRDRLVSTVTVNILKSWQSYTGGTEKQVKRSMLNIPTLPNTKFIETPGEDGSEIPDITPGEPVDSTDLGVFRSFDIRIKVEWPRAIRSLTKNPLLGTGYSSIGLATDNDVLRSLGEVGILGTAAFSLILIEIIKRLFKFLKKAEGFDRYFTAGVISVFFAFLLNSLFIDVFEASKIATLFWILIGIALFLIRYDAKQQEKKERSVKNS